MKDTARLANLAKGRATARRSALSGEAVRQLQAIRDGGQFEGLEAVIRRLLDNVVGNLSE